MLTLTARGTLCSPTAESRALGRVGDISRVYKLPEMDQPVDAVVHHNLLKTLEVKNVSK